MTGSRVVVPIRFDMSALVRRSVASLYSHLVTRPTGEALRLGIESQIGDLGAVCLSILDFRQVVVLDYSCADEAVAKLVRRFQDADRPTDAYFVARGVDDHHRETIEAVLNRHGLALVAEVLEEGYTVLGDVTAPERAAWQALSRLQEGAAAQVARGMAASEAEAAAALAGLARRRLVLARAGAPAFLSLPALIDQP